MRIIQTQAAQGDVMFRKIAALPEGLSPTKAEHGAFVVAHSETGHNHVVMERPTVKMFAAMDEFRSYLVVEDKPAKVEHLRNFDTHETIALSPGIWEVRRQREYTPEGFRRAAD
jgi:NMD protein affecting ribosome stability and mRNA decay